jgi:ATP-dependent DNA ligase
VNASGKIRDSKSVLAPRELRFIEPMYAVAVQTVPEGQEWLYEVKFDGYRWLAGRNKNGVTLWSRRGNLFTSQFPHIARACERLPAAGRYTLRRRDCGRR